jgi:hypothetical protein
MGSNFTAGDILSGATLRSSCFPVVGVMPADQTLNDSVVSTPMAGFGLQLEGNTHYALDAYIAYSTSATADIAWVIYGSFADGPFGTTTVPGVATWSFNTVTQASSNPGSMQAAFVVRLQADYSTGSIGGAGSATPEMAAKPRGWVFTGPSPGLFQLFFRQDTQNASNTTVKAGSWIRFTKLGTG